jgi:hypothetical protein
MPAMMESKPIYLRINLTNCAKNLQGTFDYLPSAVRRMTSKKVLSVCLQNERIYKFARTWLQDAMFVLWTNLH